MGDYDIVAATTPAGHLVHITRLDARLSGYPIRRDKGETTDADGYPLPPKYNTKKSRSKANPEPEPEAPKEKA